MTIPSGASKICKACGSDCSNKPRTKDAKGNYYCKPCYDAELQKKREAVASAQTTRRAPTPQPASLEPDLALDDGEPNLLEQLLVEAPATAPSGMLCPSCRSSIPAGGMLCTLCGYNLDTHGTVAKTKVRKVRHASGGVIWPWIVGIISMVFGGSGVLLYGAMLVLMVLGSLNSGRSALVSLGVGGLLTSLSAWLLRDGWRIIQHDSDGVKWIRFWAMAKGIVYGTCLGSLMAIPARSIDEVFSRMPSGQMTMTGSDIKAQILLIMVWYLFWPAFVLVFFFVPRIMRDVEQWD